MKQQETNDADIYDQNYMAKNKDEKKELFIRRVKSTQTRIEWASGTSQPSDKKNDKEKSRAREIIIK